jgi:hypothetical protein
MTCGVCDRRGSAAPFRRKPGIMQGTDKPDYGKAVDLLTRPRSKNDHPSLLPVLSPIFVYFVIFDRGRRCGRQVGAFSSVGALLGVIVTGLFVASPMTRAAAPGQCQEVHRGPLRQGPDARRPRDRRYRRRSLRDTAGPAVSR